MLNYNGVVVDLDTATVDHLRFILKQDDILNSGKIMLAKDTISQEDKIKSSLRRFNDLLERDLDSRFRQLEHKAQVRLSLKGRAFP